MLEKREGGKEGTALKGGKGGVGRICELFATDSPTPTAYRIRRLVRAKRAS